MKKGGLNRGGLGRYTAGLRVLGGRFRDGFQDEVG